jgi:thiamine-phosphate pyrophosphorylase
LRHDSVPAEVVRRRAPAGFLIGRSVRDIAGATLAAPFVDYLIAGTVWSTLSKPDPDVLLGVDGLSAIARAVRVPVLGIGGIDAARLPEVAASGAAGAAAIGLFLAQNVADDRCRATPLDSVAQLARARSSSTGYH